MKRPDDFASRKALQKIAAPIHAKVDETGISPELRRIVAEQREGG